MASFLDVCRFLPTAGGTTDFTYSSAVTGYQSPSAAGAANGAVYRYRAESADLSQWEVGYGAFNTATGVLSRSTVLFNSAGTTAKINFTAVPQVAIVALGEDLTRTHSIIPGGRLTLTSGTPITSSDVTGATTVYYTPSSHDMIPLYDGSNWVAVQFAETSLSLAGLAANTNYDVWGRVSLGALALDTTAWTNDTTRATAIAQQNGIDIKSGDPTRRLLGTIRTIGTIGQTADTKAFRFVSNRNNEVPRNMQVLEATASWSYQSTALRQANANVANQLDFVHCTPRMAAAEALFAMSNTTTNGTLQGGIGIDSTTADSATTHTQAINPATSGIFNGKANYAGYVAAGRHTLVWLEGAQNNAGTMTQYGTPAATLQCGIVGVVLG